MREILFSQLEKEIKGGEDTFNYTTVCSSSSIDLLLPPQSFLSFFRCNLLNGNGTDLDITSKGEKIQALSFNGCAIETNALFTLSKIESTSVYFSNCTIFGSPYIKDCNIDTIVFDGCVFMEEMEISGGNYTNILFKNCNFKESVFLSGDLDAQIEFQQCFIPKIDAISLTGWVQMSLLNSIVNGIDMSEENNFNFTVKNSLFEHRDDFTSVK